MIISSCVVSPVGPSSSGGINVLGRRGSGQNPVNNVLLVVLSMFLECPERLKNWKRQAWCREEHTNLRP